MEHINFKFYKTWKVLGLIGLVLILIASILPQSGELPNIQHLDKILHLSVYMIASFYFHQLFKNNYFFKVSIYLFLYSGLIELLQGLTESRSAEWQDLVANGIGLIIGYALSRKVKLLIRIDKFIGQD